MHKQGIRCHVSEPFHASVLVGRPMAEGKHLVIFWILEQKGMTKVSLDHKCDSNTRSYVRSVEWKVEVIQSTEAMQTKKIETEYRQAHGSM